MKDTQEKLLAKEEEVEQVENELIQARIDAENQYESMKVRIKFMYEGGNTQLIEMLFESESMGDFLNKAEYISQISEYDRNELIRYQDTVKRVEEKEARVQAEYDELSDLQEQLVNQQAEVEDLIESNAAQIADIQSQIDENQETLQELKEKAAEAERIRKEQLAAAQAQAAQSSGNSGGFFGIAVVRRRRWLFGVKALIRQCGERKRILHTSVSGLYISVQLFRRDPCV